MPYLSSYYHQVSLLNNSVANRAHEKHSLSSPKNTAKPVPCKTFIFQSYCWSLSVIGPLRNTSLSFFGEGRERPKHTTRSPKSTAKPVPCKAFVFQSYCWSLSVIGPQRNTSLFFFGEGRGEANTYHPLPQKHNKTLTSGYFRFSSSPSASWHTPTS